MVGEMPATAEPQTETFAPHSQSITFGLDSHTVFFNALRGLVSDGQVRMVQVATWRDDWKSIQEPRRYLLLNVVRREDMGVAGLVIEAAPGYAFLTPCTPAGVALPDAVSVIVPSVRIARIHVPRRGEQWLSSGSERQPMDSCEPNGISPAMQRVPAQRSGRRFMGARSSLATVARSVRARWKRWRTETSTSTSSLPPDPKEIPTLAGWIHSLPEIPNDQSSEPATTDSGWVIADDGHEDAGSGHSQVA